MSTLEFLERATTSYLSSSEPELDTESTVGQNIREAAKLLVEYRRAREALSRHVASQNGVAQA